MFKRILVALDGSAFAERAIPHAEQFARIFDAKILFLRVLEVPSHDENQALIDPLRWQLRKAEAEIYLRDIAEKTRANLPVRTMAENTGYPEERVEYALREGRTAENIVNFAHTEDVDLLVISTHGWGGLSRWNMSSVTQKVVNSIYLPVLIVRAYNTPAQEGSRARYRRILLPMDCSRRSECVLSSATALANGENSVELAEEKNGLFPYPTAPTSALLPARLILATVIKPPEFPVPEPIPAEAERLVQSWMRLSRRSVRDYLNTIKERTSSDCEVRVVEKENVAMALDELAAEENIDLIVMSAHGYTGEFSYPYGSVARSTMEHGAHSVLVIQDVPRSQFPPTIAELAAQRSGER
ncbi:MAG: universal stress protein [Anaerolineaceae bacterium]|nr:universal stress protein [Anaerolineaceae bacterium]